MSNDFDKRSLWRFVNKKINRVSHHYHVFAVMSTLFEEMIVDLKNGKKIKIHNFCTFAIKKRKTRYYYKFFSKEKKLVEGGYYLSFNLSRTLKKKLLPLIDFNKIKK